MLKFQGEREQESWQEWVSCRKNIGYCAKEQIIEDKIGTFIHYINQRTPLFFFFSVLDFKLHPAPSCKKFRQIHLRLRYTAVSTVIINRYHSKPPTSYSYYWLQPTSCRATITSISIHSKIDSGVLGKIAAPNFDTINSQDCPEVSGRRFGNHHPTLLKMRYRTPLITRTTTLPIRPHRCTTLGAIIRLHLTMIPESINFNFHLKISMIRFRASWRYRSPKISSITQTTFSHSHQIQILSNQSKLKPIGRSCWSFGGW